jgi:hypothetical protein
MLRRENDQRQSYRQCRDRGDGWSHLACDGSSSTISIRPKRLWFGRGIVRALVYVQDDRRRHFGATDQE